MLNVLTHPLLNYYLTELEKCKTPKKFRYTLEKIASIIVPLATSNFPVVENLMPNGLKKFTYEGETLVVAIAPTGIFLYTSLLDIIPDAKIGYLSYRHKSHRTSELEETMCFLPDSIFGSKTIIVDYAIFTGKTMRMALSRLNLEGIDDLSIISVFATPDGIENIRSEFPNVPITIAQLVMGDMLETIANPAFIQSLVQINNV